MSRLKVGDLCVVVDNGDMSTDWERKLIGATVTLVEFTPFFEYPGVPIWRVAGARKETPYVAASCLRKIDPPDESREISTWDTCPWQPAEVTA